MQESIGLKSTMTLVRSALKDAQSAIECEEVVRLLSGDWKWILDLTEVPPNPDKQLQAALNRYKL